MRVPSFTAAAARQLHLVAGSDAVDGQMAGEEGERMNYEGVRVDFLLLPQLIKDLTYWIWQRGEVSGGGTGRK